MIVYRAAFAVGYQQTTVCGTQNAHSLFSPAASDGCRDLAVPCNY